MNKFKDISVGSLVFLSIILLLQLHYFYKKRSRVKTIEDIMRELDYNQDGKITRKELKYYLEKIEQERKNNIMSINDFLQTVFGGVIRGFAMGLLLNSMEGGIVLGIMLGIINPLITMTQKQIF